VHCCCPLEWCAAVLHGMLQAGHLQGRCQCHNVHCLNVLPSTPSTLPRQTLEPPSEPFYRFLLPGCTQATPGKYVVHVFCEQGSGHITELHVHLRIAAPPPQQCCSDDHMPVTQGYMRAQYLLLHGPQRCTTVEVIC